MTRFLAFLAEAVTDHGWRLSAYVLMSNHYHLLFETPECNLSRGMKDLDGIYASWFNARHTRVGHLFQGRFKSHLVDSETYLLQVARYIVLNPVRARMVSTAAEWIWSSYRATAGLCPVPGFLDPFTILDSINPTNRQSAMAEYRDFVGSLTGSSSSPWEHLTAQVFLGGPDFLKHVEARIRECTWSSEHARAQRLFRTQTLDSVRHAMETMGSNPWPPPAGSTARVAFVWLAEERTNATRAEIGRALGLTGQGIGRLIRRSEHRHGSDSHLAALLEKARSILDGTESCSNRLDDR